MPKRDLLYTIDQQLPLRNGELSSAATVVQVSQLAMGAPYTGDLQITSQGRLIVGEHPDLGQRVVISQSGLFGYDDAGINTFAVFTRDLDDHTAGDVFAGMAEGNYLLYDQSENTFGLYSVAGAGFIADGDGSLWVGDTNGAHMHWSDERKALEIRNVDDIKISLDANGDALFDGTVYAAGGRIYGTMQVDGLLRAGDVDGPNVSLGRFTRTDGSGNIVESGEIIATDAENLPWFHVTAGGSTAGGGWFHLGGTGDYAQRLTYDGNNLVLSGTVYADAFVLSGGGSIGGGVTLQNAGKFVAGTNDDVAILDGEDDDWRIYAGNATPSLAPFRVNQKGEAWLENAHVSSAVLVGGVGGWTINTNYLAKDTGTDATSAGLAPLDWPFYAGATYANRATAPFRVSPAGALTATSGTIAGWAFNSAYIYQNALMMHSDGYVSGGANNDIAVLSGADATYRLWAGHATAASAPFRVTAAGALTATSATITGAITATSGTIGSFTIGTYLYSGSKTAYNDANAGVHLGSDGIGFGNNAFTVSAAGALTATSGSILGSLYVGSAAPRIHIDGTNKLIESTNFASGTAGFKIEGANGNAEFNNITARGALQTTALQYGYVMATNGSLWITPAAGKTIAAVTSVDSPTTFNIDVEDPDGMTHVAAGALWVANDYIRLKEPLVGDLWAKISSLTDMTTYWRLVVVKESPTAGTNYTFTAGAALLNYKASGAGSIRMTADATNSPYLSIVTHAGAPWTTLTERARLGNLTGISGASGYGLWTDNGFFTGTVTASAGSLTGFLTLGASGGIYQGTGTSGSPTTGIKLWRDGDIGRIGGYNGGVIQWYADTDGKLYAGAGKTRIDSSGISFLGATSSPDGATLNWYSADGLTLWGRHWTYASQMMSEHLSATTSINALVATDTGVDGVSAVVAVTSLAGNGLLTFAPILGGNNTLSISGTSTTLDQFSTTAAVPVLVLDQGDVSEEMIEFISTAGTGNAIEAVGSKTLTTTHFIKVTINGDTRYIPAGTIA